MGARESAASTPGFGIVPALGGIMAVAYVRAQNASIIALLEPASAVVIAFIILSQPITSTIVVGSGLILMGALMVSGGGCV